ncbi:hypothetical protein AB0B50_23670 [Streptomyces sp. NPDC041068]|uniref:beta family protein n=1 Tax=Streptomyces sp. NPDC041068 TaxID=3155130 RepID=UPI0033D8C067
MPILKGKEWEFLALSKHSPSERVALSALFEVAPDPIGQDPIGTFCLHLSKRLLEPGTVIAVDCPELEAPPSAAARVSRIAAVCSEADMPFLVPVVRFSSAAKTFTAAREIIERHQCGACLRLTVHDVAPGADRAADRIGGVLRDVGICVHDTDLLLDAGPLSAADDFSRTLQSTVNALSWLRRARWRSISLAAGAFPATFEDVTPRVPFSVFRRDAELWQQATDHVLDCSIEFSDYGIVHPLRRAVADPSSLHPFLAYTVADSWQIRIYDRQLPGNDDFFTLCDDLTKSSDWPASGSATSWGDACLHECARRKRISGKAGGATQWLAWSASHHFATVIQRMAELGRP